MLVLFERVDARVGIEKKFHGSEPSTFVSGSLIRSLEVGRHACE
jgi:hypothetical protein